MKLFSSILLLLLSISLFAHAPSSIDITFDDSLDIIYVKVAHNVPSVTAHHIKSIKLSVNGKDLIEQKFNRQSNKEYEEAFFLYRNSPDDSIFEITAACNLFGSKKQTYKLRGE